MIYYFYNLIKTIIYLVHKYPLRKSVTAGDIFIFINHINMVNYTIIISVYQKRKGNIPGRKRISAYQEDRGTFEGDQGPSGRTVRKRAGEGNPREPFQHHFSYNKESPESLISQTFRALDDCGVRDLNSHVCWHMILSHACLPIPATPHTALLFNALNHNNTCF